MHHVRILMLTAAAALLLYMTAWFLVAFRSRRLDVVDTAWGGSFIVVAILAAIIHPTATTLLVAVLVTLWGGRLMKHCWQRHSSHDQDDPRYTRLSAGWKKYYWLQVFVKVFFFQGVLAYVIAAPIIINVQAGSIGVLAVVGAVLWLAGFITESLADRQLRAFLQRPNHPKVMQEGLWRYSRHPNYFGESVQWWAIAIIALAVPWGWLGLVGPLLITTLLVFVSGIPTVERGKDKDPDYRRYQKTTSPFIPLPPRS